MSGIKAVITALFSDGCYPDYVQMRLVDAHGREWSFLEKVPVVSLEELNEGSDYPRPIVLACEEIGRRVVEGRELVLIDLDAPWGIQATDEDGTTRFEVDPNQLAPDPRQLVH